MKLALSRKTFVNRSGGQWTEKVDGRETVAKRQKVRGAFYDYCETLKEAPVRAELARRFSITPSTAIAWSEELGVARIDYDEIRYQRAVQALEGRTTPMSIAELNRVAIKGRTAEPTLKLLERRRPDLRKLVINLHEEAMRERERVISEIIDDNLAVFEIQERYGFSYSKSTKLRYEALGDLDEKADEEWRRKTLDNPEPWDKEYADEISHMKYDGYRYAGDVWKRYRALWEKKQQENAYIGELS